MKISAKLLLISFSVIVTVFTISAVIYYSLTNSLLDSQYSKSVINSSSDFANSLQSALGKMDQEAQAIISFNPNHGYNLKGLETDLFFKIEKDSLIDYSTFISKDSVYFNKSSRSIKEFVGKNRNVIFRATQKKENTVYFYGKAVTQDFLNRLSEKVRAEAALIINGGMYEVSHSYKNKQYINIINDAFGKLKIKNMFDLHKEYLDESDFFATIYTSRTISVADDKIAFLIFNNATENMKFRSTIKFVLILIIISGGALSLIMILLFTTKIRRQISLLTDSAEITAKGDLDHRVKIVTGDEIGKFGISFNKMLDELKRIKDAEREYLEFLTLLNQNPSLKEVSEAVLTKIIKGTGLTFGVIYFIDGNSLTVVSSHGISKEHVQPVQTSNFYSKAIEEKEKIEFIFNENYPEIRTGLAYIKIKYLLIFPIIYNRDVIAIIEVASENVPRINVPDYLDKIHDQLAIGLINANSLSQLESYIEELKTLNEEYAKQNIQIKGQNDKLIELHNQLREKAEELEEKRNQAVELTKVKSQFLANMSHELKTPLISIIGLTELTLKEQIADKKLKERFNVVFRNGKKLLNMINNILEFSKFESGNLEIKNEVFLLNELLSDLKENINPLAKEKGLIFNIGNLSSEVLVNTDKVLLERVLSNILFNAIKFTEKGSVELNIRFSVHNSKDIEFEIKDTGIGISEEDQKVIFNEFKQIDEGYKKTYSGAGLGLAICKRYADMLGGTITLRSRIGSGSIFSVKFPGIIIEIIQNVINAKNPIVPPEPIKKDLNVMLFSANNNTKELIQDYLSSYSISLKYYSTANELPESGIKRWDAVLIDVDAGPEIWKVIYNLKKECSIVPVIILRMIEKEKIGFGMLINDFLFGKLNNAILTSLTEILTERKTLKNICIIKVENLQNPDSYNLDGVSTIIYSGWEALESYIVENGIGAVIVEMLEPFQNSIDIIYQLRNHKKTKNIFTALNMPLSISDNNSRMVFDEIENITIKSKSHPMDALKILRDKLALSAEIEHTEEEIAVVLPSNGEAHISKKILIVDDDKDTLFTIGQIINGIGYETFFASNGVECLAALPKIKPDLILLDIMMPQMDGFETIQRIRKDEKFKHIPVAALTAYEMLDNKEVIEKNGFDDLITKPIDSNSMAFKIEKLFAIVR